MPPVPSVELKVPVPVILEPASTNEVLPPKEETKTIEPEGGIEAVAPEVIEQVMDAMEKVDMEVSKGMGLPELMKKETDQDVLKELLSALIESGKQQPAGQHQQVEPVREPETAQAEPELPVEIGSTAAEPSSPGAHELPSETAGHLEQPVPDVPVEVKAPVEPAQELEVPVEAAQAIEAPVEPAQETLTPDIPANTEAPAVAEQPSNPEIPSEVVQEEPQLVSEVDPSPSGQELEATGASGKPESPLETQQPPVESADLPTTDDLRAIAKLLGFMPERVATMNRFASYQFTVVSSSLVPD